MVSVNACMMSVEHSVSIRPCLACLDYLGQETKRMENIVDANAELCCATLDDRERKLIVGDSLGHITVYNCLTGVVLKCFPRLPCAVRTLIYSDDKIVIALAGQGTRNNHMPSNYYFM